MQILRRLHRPRFKIAVAIAFVTVGLPAWLNWYETRFADHPLCGRWEHDNPFREQLEFSASGRWVNWRLDERGRLDHIIDKGAWRPDGDLVVLGHSFADQIYNLVERRSLGQEVRHRYRLTERDALQFEPVETFAAFEGSAVRTWHRVANSPSD
jgi:hypothetical protein